MMDKPMNRKRAKPLTNSEKMAAKELTGQFSRIVLTEFNRQNYTYTRLAMVLNMTRQRAHQIVNGSLLCAPTLRTVANVCSALGIKVKIVQDRTRP